MLQRKVRVVRRAEVVAAILAAAEVVRPWLAPEFDGGDEVSATARCRPRSFAMSSSLLHVMIELP